FLLSPHSHSSAAIIDSSCPQDEACLVFRLNNNDEYEVFLGSYIDIFANKRTEFLRFSIGPINRDDCEFTLATNVKNVSERIEIK
ncbi:hypothetical protein PMAYCL1PPCAC_12976, partial [Pristionchus mayeri]